MADQPPAPQGGSASAAAHKSPTQPLKRACDQCNMRRVKCSHEQPCAHCLRLGINCTYWKAARGKVSSGKRIEKLRRDQAIAAAQAASSGPGGPAAASSSSSSSHQHQQQQSHPGPSAYPLGHFGPQHHHPSPPQPPLAKMEETFNQTLTAVGAAAAIQYAGPSSHFPAPTPSSQTSLSPNGLVDHAQHQHQLSTPSPHHQQQSYPPPPLQPQAVSNPPAGPLPLSRPAAAAAAAEQAYPTSTQSQHQNQDQQQHHHHPQHVPPAVHLGSAFFPPSLTTISPSTAANFRLPDLSTSLVDEFHAQSQHRLPQQPGPAGPGSHGFESGSSNSSNHNYNTNPASNSRNFFDWGVGMLGGGISTQQQQQQQQRADTPAGPAQQQQQHGTGMRPPETPHLYSSNPNGMNAGGGGGGGGLNASHAPPAPSLLNSDLAAANNARLNLADWGMGILTQGPGPAALQSPRGSTTGTTPSISEGSRSGAASPAITTSLTSLYSTHPNHHHHHQGSILSGGPRNRAISLNEYVPPAAAAAAGRPNASVNAAAAASNDFVYGLQQQQQQRLVQEQQLLRAQQQRSHHGAATPSPASSAFQQALAGSGGGAAAASRSSHVPLPKSDQGAGANPPLLAPTMQGVLPSTLEILNGYHPLSDYILLPHIGLYFERLHPIMPVFSRSWMFSKLDKGDQHSDVHFAAMLLAMSAFALIQPQEAKERASARARVKKAKALLEESIRLRNAVLFGKDPSLEATMTSFYMFACLFGLGEEQAAWFRLHEAVALGTLLKMHRPDSYASLERDEAERRLRAYWLLVITERAYSLQRGHSLGFRGHPEEVTRSLKKQFGLEELADFPQLQLKLFDAVDEDFVECWNGHCGAAAVRATLQGKSSSSSSSSSAILSAAGSRTESGAATPNSAAAADKKNRKQPQPQQQQVPLPEKLGCSTFDRQRALKLWATFQQSEKEINDEVLAAEAQNASKTSKAKAAAAAKRKAAAGGGGGGAEGTPSSDNSGGGRAGSISRSEDERQAEFERQKIQLADHRITAQWLLNRLWNLCLTHGHIDLSPPSSSSTTTATATAGSAATTTTKTTNAVVVPPPFRLDAALRIARKMLTICHELDQPAMEAHGIGLMEKLYDVAMTLVLLCRDYPGLAKRIGLVDLNLKRGNSSRGSKSGNDGAGGGGSGSGSGANGGGGGGEGGKRRADGSGRGYSEHGGRLDQGEDGNEYDDSYQPPALSPSVPGFYYPLTTTTGNGSTTTTTENSSKDVVSGIVTVKREDQQQQPDATPTPTYSSSASSVAPRMSARRPLRQAPTAIESILQEYVEIFRAFRAGDHPYLEKMVVAMKELAIQHGGGGGGAGTSSLSGSGGGGGGGGGGGAASSSGSRSAIGQRRVAPVPAQSQHGRLAGGKAAGGGGGGNAVANGVNATLAAGYNAPDSSTASQADRLSAMQHASAYVFTPPPSGAGPSSTDPGPPVSSSSVGPGKMVEAAAAASSFPQQQQPQHGHAHHHHHHYHVLSPSGGSSSGMSSPGFTMLSSMPTPVSAPPGISSFQQSQLSQSSPGASPFTPPFAGGLTTTTMAATATAAGMEWSQMPEDLGWPSIEHFLRECGLWDMAAVPQQQQQQQQQHQQSQGLAAEDGIGLVGGPEAFVGQGSQQDHHHLLQQQQQQQQFSMGP